MEEEKPRPGKAFNLLLPAVSLLLLAAATLAVLKYADYLPGYGRKQAPDVFSPRPAPAQAKKEKLPGTEGISFQLRVAGSPEFEKSVKAAAFLIWKNDIESFKFIKNYVYVIRRADKTDFSVETGVPTAFITDNTALYSPTWCAGAIAHQAFHSYLYYRRKHFYSTKAAPPAPGKAPAFRPPPYMTVADDSDFSSALRLERDADRFQIRVMKKTGAPRAEIKLIEKREDADLSLTHDGR